jgi:hypothetical protein
VAQHLLRLTQQHLAEELPCLTQQHLAKELPRLTQQHLAEELRHLTQYHFPYSFLTPHQRFSSSHGHYNPKEKTTSYCNVNSKELHHKQQQRKNKSTTIEEGDDIVAVTFAAAKPQKKGKFAISLQQREKGGGSCRLLLQ